MAVKKNTHCVRIIVAILAMLPVSDSFSANYYWVGGSGNWDNLNHWVTTSGGSIMQVQIPTAGDDVYFDSNSFLTPGDTVNINISHALCKNMNWTGSKFSPFLAGESVNSINIYGSLTFINQMNLVFGGTVNFESTNPGMTITSGGHKFLNAVNFNGAGGEWTLTDDFSVLKSLVLNSGALITNNYDVIAGNFSSPGNKLRSLKLGSSLFTITDAGIYAFSADFTNFSIDAGASAIRFSYNGSCIIGLNLRNANSDVIFNNVEFTGTNPTDSIINVTGYSVIFNNVKFNSDGRITGNNTINGVLTLSSGKVYIISSGSIQTINGSISATGNCLDYVTIESSTYLGYATLYKPSGVINVDHLLIENIHATGGAVWNAANSIKIYNAVGWNTTNPENFGADYYWIGGSGNWSDPSHWSLTSGGAANAAGCIPQSENDVYFDANSFNSSGQTINIDLPFASCKNMNWTGALFSPAFASPVFSCLKIFGSLTLIPAMNYYFNGQISFEAKTTGHTITSAGNHFRRKVDFCGAGGGWILSDDFNSFSSLCLSLGNLNTNNKKVSVYKFDSSVDYYRSLTLGSSIINITGSQPDAFTAYFKNMTFCPGTSTIRFTSDSSNTGMLFDISPADVSFYNVEFTGVSSNVTLINKSASTFIFNNLLFEGNGVVMGDYIYNGTLTLSPGKIYSFQAGKTQTLNGNISANGGCGNNIIIRSTLNGVAAKFTKSGGSVNVNKVMLKDIYASGGANWNANNSVILTNVNGWNVTAPSNSGVGYYWTGGSGNWSDPAHWSLTSGGAANAAGCIPGYSNNVYFDANSFSSPGQTVTIDINPAACNDMVWTGALFSPSLNGAPVMSLKIYGSLTFIQAMNYNFKGQIFFDATSPGKSISTAGNTFLNFINFTGAGGGWIISDSLSSLSKVNLLFGSLNTNGKPVRVCSFFSNTNTARTLELGSSVITITGTGYSGFHAGFENMNLDAAKSTLRFTTDCGDAGMTLESASSVIVFNNVDFTDSSASGYIRNVSGKSAVFNNVNFSGDAHNYGNNIFNDVVIAGSGFINGINSFRNLTFTAGETYTLQAGLIQTIHGDWWFQGKCTSYIMLYSSVYGYPAYISKATGVVNAFLVHIRDIHCSGGAAFNAYNSVDLGGASGWVFPDLPFMTNLTGIIGPQVVCTGNGSYTYYVNSTGALSYLWTVPANATIIDGQNDTLINISFSGASSGDISVYAFNGCGYSLPSVLPVTVYNSPDASFHTDIDSGCAPLSVNFFINSPLQQITYSWQFGDGMVSNEKEPLHIYSSHGSYGVLLTVTDYNGCKNTASAPQPVNVFPTPETDFTRSPDDADILNSNLFFTPVSDHELSEWLWDFGDDNLNTSDIKNPSHYYANSGNYIVSLKAKTKHGCSDTSSHTITVKNITTFWMPDAFTPDNDGFNDEFKPVMNNRNLSDYRFMVFDRWGALIFITEDIDKGWKGMQKGGSLQAPCAAYVWKVSFRENGQSAKEAAGMVTLIR